LLLDTHVLVWAVAEPERLSAKVRSALEDSANDLVVSAVSAAEIEIKKSIGKLRLQDTTRDLVLSIEADWLDLTVDHCEALAALPLLHRDPFDRLLVAQARVERLTLVTADPQLLQYDLEAFRD
jgi:PIN domain nuclease of toxin-antitoxin system